MHDYNHDQDSLSKIVREIVPQGKNHACVEHLLLTFEQLEIEIQDLEKRLQMIKQEVKVLISEK